MVKRLATLTASASVLLAPAVALACPYCAGQQGDGIGRSIALGAFITLPFVVAAFVIKFIRSEARVSKVGEAE